MLFGSQIGGKACTIVQQNLSSDFSAPIIRRVNIDIEVAEEKLLNTFRTRKSKLAMIYLKGLENFCSKQSKAQMLLQAQ